MVERIPTLRQMMATAKSKRPNSRPWTRTEARHFIESIQSTALKLELEADDFYESRASESYLITMSLYEALAIHVSSTWADDSEMVEDMPRCTRSDQMLDTSATMHWLALNWDYVKDRIMSNNNSYTHFEKMMVYSIDGASQIESHFYQSDKYLTRNHWNTTPQTGSNQPLYIQNCVADLCVLWHGFVDDELQLPSSSRNPENPLLRFVSALLREKLGSKAPRNFEIYQYIITHFRPWARENLSRSASGSEGSNNSLF